MRLNTCPGASMRWARPARTRSSALQKDILDIEEQVFSAPRASHAASASARAVRRPVPGPCRMVGALSSTHPPPASP
jgi:hypothetical protein